MISTSRHHLRANLFMLAAAMIWGSAFVAQRLSLYAIGPFLFTGVRFLLGAGIVATLVFVLRRRTKRSADIPPPRLVDAALLRAGGVLGVLLAVAISLQQIGLGYTKIANAGFISSLYVIIVPLIGVLLRHRTGAGTWIGAVLAVIGLYLLSINEHFSIMYGDWYQLGCAIVISLQVMLVGRYAPRHDPLALSVVQFVACGAICLAIGVVCEPVELARLVRATPTILYGGAISVGIGYTLQVVAQRDAAPAHAAVIFSMEGVFAALAGWLALGETLTPRALTGCAAMLAGLLVCQLLPQRGARIDENTEPQFEPENESLTEPISEPISESRRAEIA